MPPQPPPPPLCALILKHAGDAPLLPERAAPWPLSLPRAAAWAELAAAVHALLRARAGWDDAAGDALHLYVGAPGCAYTPFTPAPEQRVVDVLAAFALRAPRGAVAGAADAPPPVLVVSYARAPAW